MNTKSFSKTLISLIVLASLLLTALAVLPGSAMANLAATSWPIFQHDLMHSGRSQYIGPQTNNVKWSYQTGNIVSSSPAIGADGTIYVGSYDNNLYAINPNGTRKWTFPTGVYGAPAIGSDGTIYAGSSDNYLYAITDNVTAGIQKWRFGTLDHIESCPAIGGDGTLYVGSDDGYLYAITDNLTAGIQKWRFGPTNNSISASPAIGSNGTIYVGSWNNYIYAITDNGTAGNQKWRFQTGGDVVSSPAIASDGTIYEGSNDAYIYAITDNGTAGNQKWQFQTGGEVLSSPAIGSDGTIYAGSLDDYLYAINPNGTQKWSYRTGGLIVSSPAIGNDGTVYVHSEDGNLYAVTPNGTLVWSYMTGQPPRGPMNFDSSAAIGSDGTLYVGAFNGKVYAFKSAAVGSATASVNTSLGTVNFNTSAGSISGLTNLSPESMPCSAGGFIFPYGMFSYSITNLTPGQTVTVTIHIPVAIPMGSKVFKCQNGNLTDFTQYVQQTDPNTFILTLKDGGPGDSDGVANGTIVDPCGPAFTDTSNHHRGSTLQPMAPQGPAPMANIAVQSASLSIAKVAPGAPITVNANVANKGTANGSTQVKLYVNGQEEAHQGVTLSSGGNTPIKFTVSRDEPGSYSVYVGSLPAGTFEVDRLADPNLILYISGAVLLFALAGGVIFMTMRRR
ncbi:MAG: PQQ-binding-like beta-propeller repeat protein [Dehalococcoidia bacterium]|jgi:outer membrane protein assembly factor BamB